MTRIAIVVAAAIAATVLFGGCAGAPSPAETAPTVQIVYLQHAKSAELQSVLSGFVKDAQLAEGRQDGQKLVVAVHPEANAVMLSGDPQRIEQAKNLIARLDRAQ